MKLFKWFSLAAMAWGCCAGVVGGRDVVEPPMPNVDLEVQQFRKVRAAILRQTVKEMGELWERRVPGNAVPELLRLRPGTLHARSLRRFF